MYIYNNEHNILSGPEIKTIFIHNIILSINKSEVSNRRRKINFFFYVFLYSCNAVSIPPVS